MFFCISFYKVDGKNKELHKKRRKKVANGKHKKILSVNEKLTRFTQLMLGTGLPEALHSNVTVLPLRAVTCPVSGCARTVGGTNISTVCTKSRFS